MFELIIIKVRAMQPLMLYHIFTIVLRAKKKNSKLRTPKFFIDYSVRWLTPNYLILACQVTLQGTKQQIFCQFTKFSFAASIFCPGYVNLRKNYVEN